MRRSIKLYYPPKKILGGQREDNDADKRKKRAARFQMGGMDQELPDGKRRKTSDAKKGGEGASSSAGNDKLKDRAAK
jgi:hypothetical protein